MSNSSVTEQVKGRQDVFSSVSSLSVIKFDMSILGEKNQGESYLVTGHQLFISPDSLQSSYSKATC